ncbi:hypothetical protein FOC1_g10006094 [Fusarium oxysporum f. sp. cubense race 1]|uniref:MACPF domain-containing protein n=1 Tax=Fusarium oxysporum f. sp. cubense (strain race 1) TaxID=1229664 RepID=N4UIP7_FUSC1|nr:hypothetical protein FOC1_g10006094 [Fusarium oxysporum f. sp. cubense race 1]
MLLLLARYDDAMRQGMGLNSYTQTMCIESAVEATDENMTTSQTLPPKITYSSKLFEWVSEVVHTMDISSAVTIKTSSMEVHGHINVLNDAKINDAHISLMISVRVMSQITNLKGSAKSLPIDGIEAGSPRFNETFGDSYISGIFIKGGLFTNIISFICSNPEQKVKMIEAVKKASADATMDLDNVCKVAAITSVIRGVKVEDVTGLTHIFAAQVDKPRANSLELNTLQASRSALDKEINKIVSVNTLTRHPELLPKIDSLNKNPRDELAYGIINEALLESPQPGSLEDSQVQHNSFLPSVAGYSPSETSSGVKELHTPWTSDLDSASLSGRSLVFREKVNTSTDLTMHALVPPEVWTDLLPVKNDPTTSLISQMTKTVLAFNVNSSEDLRRFVDNADHGTPRDWPYIRFNRETIKDEHLGKDGMTGVVFYTYSIVNGVQSAVSMGTAGFNGANDNLLKKDSKEVKPYQITLGKGIEAPEQVYRTPLMKLTRCERKMVFSSEFPYWDIYNSEDEQLWRARGLHLV